LRSDEIQVDQGSGEQHAELLPNVRRGREDSARAPRMNILTWGLFAPASSVSGEPGDMCRVERRAMPNEDHITQRTDKLTSQRATTLRCHSLITQCEPTILVENRTDRDRICKKFTRMSTRSLCVHRRKPTSIPKHIPVGERYGSLHVLRTYLEMSRY